jgi:hypothetical protein
MSKTTWIAAFTDAMRRLGRHKHFFAEPCKEHPDCVLVQLRRQEEHIAWREEMAAAAAKALAKSAG